MSLIKASQCDGLNSFYAFIRVDESRTPVIINPIHENTIVNITKPQTKFLFLVLDSERGGRGGVSVVKKISKVKHLKT